MCDECQLGESVGWFEFMRISFGGKTDVNKMSDDEKTALLKALQANLQEKGCWTAEWLSASGVPCPPVRRALKNYRYFHFIGVVRRHYRAFTRRSGYDVW